MIASDGDSMECAIGRKGPVAIVLTRQKVPMLDRRFTPQVVASEAKAVLERVR